MKVEIKITNENGNGIVTVTKEKGDPVFKTTEWALAESTFLYHVKKELLKQGFDCIKKRMWKDGHLMDDEQQYIRDRRGKWAIWNAGYSVYDAGQYFNEHGEVVLAYNVLERKVEYYND